MPTKFDLWPMATLLFNLWPMATLLSSNMIGLFIGYLLPTPARRWLNTDSSGWYYSKIIKLLRFSNLKIMFSKRIFGLWPPYFYPSAIGQFIDIFYRRLLEKG
jgi:hypothetical protein